MAIGRTSGSAVARLCDEATRRAGCQFLEEVLIVVSCKLHTILTDRASKGATGSSPLARGIQFGPSQRETAARSCRAKAASA